MCYPLSINLTKYIGVIMFEQERKILILNQLNEQTTVSVKELSNTLNVSLATIRRDLDSLEQQGLAIRTHGGAILAQNVIDSLSFDLKKTKNFNLKDQIAFEAAQLIKDGDVVFIDSSTITALIPQYIKAKKYSIITNSLNIAHQLKDDKECNLIILGGYYMQQAETIEGTITISQLQNMRFKKAFLGANGIDVDFGFSTMSEMLALTKLTALKQASKSYFLCEHLKFNYTSLHKICNLDEVDFLITDNSVDVEVYNTYSKHIEIIKANK